MNTPGKKGIIKVLLMANTPLSLRINADQPGPTIDKNIYGHFAEHLGRCIDEGIWVGEDSPIPNTRGIRNDVVQAFRNLQLPVMRWPGGCFADEYHWKDGIGPRTSRVPMVNTHWGGVPETNQFGTHEFYDFCEQVGCEPYVNGNVGSGTVREMAEWVEYITHDGSSPMAQMRQANGRDKPWQLKYFGVGNENWGCGGSMRPEYYADLFRRYSTYVRNFSGNKVFKIACGPNDADYNWTEVLMREAAKFMDGLTLHFYTVFWSSMKPATGFDEADWFAILQKCLQIEELVRGHSAIMDRYDPDKRVSLIVDEWGTWYAVEPGTNPGFLYQQNTLRDALVAGITLNIFNTHAGRIRMANLAQAANVLQALVLTDGPKMVLTPTYHVFDLYKGHHGAALLPCTLDTNSAYEYNGQSIPQVNASASRQANGDICVTLCNADPHQPVIITCHIAGDVPQSVRAKTLTAQSMDARNEFDAEPQVQPQDLKEASISEGTMTITLPPMSVTAVTMTSSDS